MVPKHPANRDSELTRWTDEGLAYCEAHKDDEPPVELTPGLHWKVIEPEVNLRQRDYITYPNTPDLIEFRHEWIMVLQARPFVPQPSGAPMPEKQHTPEERSRILSLYLRPWVLFKKDKTPDTRQHMCLLLQNLIPCITIARLHKSRVRGSAKCHQF